MTAAAETRPRKRGVVLLLLFLGLVLAILVALGTWQLERKAWKEALIDTIEHRVAASPAALPTRERWMSLDPADDEFRRGHEFRRLLHPRDRDKPPAVLLLLSLRLLIRAW